MTQAAATYAIEIRTQKLQHTAVIRETVPMSEIGPWMGAVFAEVGGHLARAGGQMAGPPFSRYFGMPASTADVEAGFPVDRPVAPGGRVVPGELPAGPAAVTVHSGLYETIGAAYEAIGRWLAENKRQPAGPPWEVYLTDPVATPDPAQWRTEVIQPLLP